MSRGQIHHFAAKFRLIRAGLLVDATDLDTFLASKFSRSSLAPKKKDTKRGEEDMMDDEAMEVDEESEGEEESVDIEESINFVHSPEEYIQRIDEYVEKAFAAQKAAGITEVKTTQITEALRRLERSFLRSIPPNGCANCRGQNPKFRKEGMHKIFQRSLSAKQNRQMKAKGLEFERLNIHATADFSKTTEEPVTVITEDGTVAVHSGGATVEEDVSEHKARYLTPMEVKEHIERLWSKEKDFLDLMLGSPKSTRRPSAHQSYRKSSPDIFFLEVVAVPPNRFRPLSKMNDKLFEHSQNIYLSEVLKSNQLIADLYREHNERLKNDPQTTSTSDMMSRIVNSCINLQVGVVNFLDSSGAPLMKGKQAPPGIRQLLEKKEGLFRKHMMGKRVNYAARSVISPDPNIETNEIGVPPVFATKLTYPDPVTSHNIELMRAAVINGPDKWPGATHVQNEDGSLLNLGMFDEAGRTAIANQLLTPDTGVHQRTKNVNKKVYRHLKNGDFLLLNRQPTLHKPSIMAHTAKVLPGEKTIRMHYANW
jgi:DNA-directed RNA polymerase I subunit RPA1